MTGRAPKAATEDQLASVWEELTRLTVNGEWTTYRRLALSLGVHERVVRLAARELVRRGYAVVSDARYGYTVARDPEVLRDAAERLRSRGIRIMERATDLERTADRIEREDGSGPQAELPLDTPGAGGKLWA